MTPGHTMRRMSLRARMVYTRSAIMLKHKAFIVRFKYTWTDSSKTIDH